MEINVQHWTEVRSLKRPELAMLNANGLVQTCTAKKKSESIASPSLPKLVCFDRGYVKNFFLQYFYEILVQEALTAAGDNLNDENEDEVELVTVKSIINEVIDEFTSYLEELSGEELAKDSLELYRSYRATAFHK